MRGVFFWGEGARLQNFKKLQLASGMEQLSCHLTDFHEMYLEVFFFFENLSRKFSFDENIAGITSTVNEHQSTFMMYL
jgi:hypothetical protein